MHTFYGSHLYSSDNPFDLGQPEAYRTWREQKLAHYPQRLNDLIVEIGNIEKLTAAEHQAILTGCRQANMAIYATNTSNITNNPINKDQIRLLGSQFGLKTLDHNPGADADAITALTVQNDTYHREYIPYSNKAISWHTDGYYNIATQQIHGIILHCLYPATTGGHNKLLDHEMLYIALRDANPEYIQALMHPEVMTIPANIVNGQETRPANSGPVFKISATGSLHMRYTDRTRSIIWRDDPITQEAVAALKDYLHNSGTWCFEACLEAGQGLIANNVLHTRSAFEDGVTPRLLYRARYYDRIQGT